MQATAPLTVHNATIHTATVEIKTLTLSGKQVTLSVFRQLQEEALIDEDATGFLGLPWGTVNYHPDAACKDAEDHLHVIWQKGGELRRAFVKASPPAMDYMQQEKRLEGERFDNAVEWWWITSILDNHARQPVQREDGSWMAWLSSDEISDGERCVSRVAGDFEYSLKSYLLLNMDEARTPRGNVLVSKTPPYQFRKETPEEVSERILRSRKELLPSMNNRRALLERTLDLTPEARSHTYSVVSGCLRAKIVAKEEYATYMANYGHRWVELQSLDQLFIAV